MDGYCLQKHVENDKNDFIKCRALSPFLLWPFFPRFAGQVLENRDGTQSANTRIRRTENIAAVLHRVQKKRHKFVRPSLSAASNTDRTMIIDFFLVKLNDMNMVDRWFQRDRAMWCMAPRSCDLTRLDFFVGCSESGRSMPISRYRLMHSNPCHRSNSA